MERELIISIVNCFFVAAGVIIGGSIVGGLGSFLVGKAPLLEMANLAKALKIWAIVAAIGGTFDAIYNFERGFLDGSMFEVFKQVLLIIAALVGANVGATVIQWLTQESI